VEPAGAAVLLSESQARLEEGQLELAFLADPMLFSYGLGAHVQGVTVEVRGYVPTDAVRERVLTVARQQSALPVIDKLKLHPTLAGHGAVDRPENILQAAQTLLAGAFPDQGPAMNLKCDAHGRITVAGSVGSFEDKVLVSRKLRQVPGCSCVLNQLSVGVGRHDSRPSETLHGPGVLTVPPGIARPASRLSESPTPSLRPVAMPLKRDQDVPPLSPPRVQAPPPAPLPHLTGLPAEPAPTRWAPQPPLVIPMPPSSAGTLKPAPEKKETPRPVPPPPVPPLVIPPLDDTRPAPPIRLPEASRPALPPVSLPQSRAPAADKRIAGGNEESYVSEGTITFGDDPPPAKPAASGPSGIKPKMGTLAPVPPPLPPSRPASARLDLSVPPATMPAPPTLGAPARPLAARLKERIQGVCGPAYDVKVTATAKDHLHVVVTARDERDGQRLMDKIIPVLREFATVAIDVDIDPMTSRK